LPLDSIEYNLNNTRKDELRRKDEQLAL